MKSPGDLQISSVNSKLDILDLVNYCVIVLVQTLFTPFQYTNILQNEKFISLSLSH